MNATSIREAARVAALIAILMVAAILGLAVGNTLNDRSGTDAAQVLGGGGMVHGKLVLPTAGPDLANHDGRTPTTPTPR
ncbi:MAG: hypothetical protein ACRDG7_13310 [Candidatus Limnocylindria bacterium]